MQSPEGCNDAQASLDDLDWKEIQSHLIGQNARTSMAARQVAASYLRERRVSIATLDEADLNQSQEESQEEVEESSGNRQRMTHSLSNLRQTFGMQAPRYQSWSAGTSAKKSSLPQPLRSRKSMNMSPPCVDGSDTCSIASSSSGRPLRRLSLPSFQSGSKLMASDQEPSVGSMRDKFHNSLSSLQTSLRALTTSEETSSHSSSGASIASGSLSSCSTTGKLEVDFPEGGRRSNSTFVVQHNESESNDACDNDLSNFRRSTFKSGQSCDIKRGASALLPRVQWEKFPAPSRSEAMKKTDSARKLIDGLLVIAPERESCIHEMLDMKASRSSSFDS